MLNREIIQEQAPHELDFLDDRWDAALLGYAESGRCGGTVMPCYGYQLAKAHLNDLGLTYKQVFKRLSHLLSSKALVLRKYGKAALWKNIADNAYPHWDSLDNSILGIASIGWNECGVIYSKPKVIDLLKNNQVSSDYGDFSETILAVQYADQHIIPVDVGPNTPFYLTPIQK